MNPVIAYFDCYSGISGDMTLGAIVDAGVSIGTLAEELRRLPVAGYELECESVSDSGLSGTRVRVKLNQHSQSQGHRHLSHIQSIIGDSSLGDQVKARSLAVFKRLAEAEASVHGCSVEEVHFHEVGAVDTIVDVVGCVVGLEMLGVRHVYASPLPLGSGTVTCEHGILPVPAPATLELCRRAQAPVRATDVASELVTPTGAAIVCTLASFARPAMRLTRIGYGFGAKKLPWPNALRLWVGEPVDSDAEQDVVAVIETNVDDMTPELLGAAMDRLLQIGALDVSFEPVQMKKNRPGVKVAVMVEPERAEEIARQLLEHTTTLGVRIHEARRLKCRRWLEKVETPWGEVFVKFRSIAGQQSAAPEYEDCIRVARTAGVGVPEVYAAARAAAEAKTRLD